MVETGSATLVAIIASLALASASFPTGIVSTATKTEGGEVEGRVVPLTIVATEPSLGDFLPATCSSVTLCLRVGFRATDKAPTITALVGVMWNMCRGRWETIPSFPAV